MSDKHEIIVNGTSIYYEILRPDKKDIVIFVHGLGGDHRGLLNCARELHNFRTILFDLPGYGNSQAFRKEHSLINYANFLEDLRKKLKINKFSIVAHSFGAPIAKIYAKLFPNNLNSIVLLNPVLVPASTLSWWFSQLYAKVAMKMPNKLSRFMFSNKLIVYLTDTAIMTRSGKKYRKQILNQDFENYKKADIRALKDSVKALSDIKLELFANNNKVKSMIIFGKSDALVNRRNILDKPNIIQNTKTIIYPGGHLLPLEDPIKVGHLINNFLKS